MSLRLAYRKKMGKIYRSVFVAAAALSLCSYSASAAAPAQFLKKVPISLSADAQTAIGQETLSGFPVLVRLSTAISGFSYDDITADHSDMAFGTDDGSVITLYPFEVDTWNTNGTSLVWVRVPSLAAASSFNLYYGKGGSVANTPSDVWAGYAGVWHLNEASGTAYDSTINGLNATASGANSSECVAVSTAPTGTGRQLTSVKGHKSYLSVPNYSHLGLCGTFAISAWVKADACYASYSARYFSRKSGYKDTNGWEAEQSYNTSASVAATTISARGANDKSYTGTVPNITANWAYVVLSFNGTTLQYYVNGVAAETQTLGAAATDNEKTLSIGNNPSGSESNWVGAMDEIRLRGFVPSAAWEAAEYATVADSAFLVYGSATGIDGAVPIFGTGSASVSGNDVTFSVEVSSLPGSTSVSVFYSADGGATFTEHSLGAISAPGTLTGSASGLGAGAYVWYATAVSEIGGTDRTARTPQHAFAVTRAKLPATACKCLTATIAYSGTAVSGVPVLLRLSESIEGFHYSDVTASGFEFLDEDGNLLPYEIDTWSPGGTSLIWVLPPSFADGAELTIRYGGNFSNPGFPASDVWASYVGVWHMNKILEDPVTGKHYTPDSSASGWHAYKVVEEDTVPAPVTSATGVTAHPAPFTGTAMDIAYNTGKASSDRGGFIVPASQTSSTTLSGPGFTFSTFVNSQQIANNGRCRAIAFGNAYNDRANLSVGSDNIHLMSYTNHKKANPNGKTGWVYASAVFGSKSFIYANGSNLSGSAGDNPILTSMTLEKGIGLGCFTDGKQCLDGYLDETRIRNAASSAAWIAAEYAAIVNDVFSFGQVTIVDTTTPALAVPTFVRNQDGSFTITVGVSENVPASVVCTLGGTDYPMSSSDLELPMSYSVTVSNLASGTYVPNVTAMSTTDHPVYSVCPTAFHAGALTVTKVSDADEGTLTPGVFRVARADADSTGLLEIPFDVEFSGDGLAVVVDPGVSTFTIPAGSAYVDVSLTPVYTTAVDEDKTITVLVSGAVVGQSSTATLTVFNADYDPSVRYVDTNGSDANHGGTPEFPKQTIGAAVKSLANVAHLQACTVHVAPGLYTTNPQVYVTNAISIVGADADPSQTIVSNSFTTGWEHKNQRCFYVNHPAAKIANLTMQKGGVTDQRSGGTLYIGSRGGMVTNCVVECGTTLLNSYAGGACLDGGLVTHTIFRKNQSGCDGGSWQGSNKAGVLALNGSSHAENCLFVGNNQGNAVVLVHLYGSSVMRNCAIVDSALSKTNDYCKSWSALVVDSGATAQNVVIAGVTNKVDGAPCPPTGSVAKFLNGAFDGNVAGLLEGTITGTAAEFFEDYANGDYTPKVGGPLVNVGADYDGMAAVDLAGGKRKIGKHIDIGCYECQKIPGFFIFVR